MFTKKITRGELTVLLALVVTALVLLIGELAFMGVRGVCASEDSPSCIWIGPVQGNGGGGIVINGPDQP